MMNSLLEAKAEVSMFFLLSTGYAKNQPLSALAVKFDVALKLARKFPNGQANLHPISLLPKLKPGFPKRAGLLSRFRKRPGELTCKGKAEC
jgi:hypothetical protein